MKLDCGHEEDEGYPATIIEDGKSKIIQGWTFSYSLDEKRKLCHKCYCEEILDCGHKVGEHSYITSGFGVNAAGKKSCYACCAEEDKKVMRKYGKHDLYLCYDEKKNKFSGTVTNWPGSLVIACRIRVGDHNWTGNRYDCWFEFEGVTWHGVTIGDNTDICHCKKLKS